MLSNILLMIMTGFAWAIGGEKYFGKWKRGMLVAIPFAIKGVMCGAMWFYYPILLFLAWATYQMLFYDACIKLIWPQVIPNPCNPSTMKTAVLRRGEVIIGVLGLMVNGLLCAGIPSALLICGGFFEEVWIVLGTMAVAFPFICWLSNGLKLKIPCWCVRYMGVKLWCPEDSWWLACWIFGLILGAMMWLA